MKSLYQPLKTIADWMAIIGFGGLVFVALLSFSDAVLRTLSLNRIWGLNDLREVSLAVIVASCFPYGLIIGNNVTVRILRLALPSRWARWLEVFAAVVTLGFFIVIVFSLGGVAMELTAANRTTMTLETPLAPWVWMIETAFVLCVLIQSTVVIRCVTNAHITSVETSDT